MFLQSMLQNTSTLGRLGAVTLAASRVVVQSEEAQKLVPIVWCVKSIKEAQVWISSDLGFEQTGKSTLHPLL